jgi:hypothetical protein
MSLLEAGFLGTGERWPGLDTADASHGALFGAQAGVWMDDTFAM